MKRSRRRSLLSLFRRGPRSDNDRRRPASHDQRTLALEVLEDRTLLAADPLVLPTITLTVSVGDLTGDIQFETLPHLAPVTVENFANYIEDGDFINSIFHRLDKIPGQQVIQGGWLTSPTQEFTSGDQFSFVPTDPAIVNESDATLRPNVRGAVGMARTSDPDSATSQFYINTEDNPGFDQPLNPDGFAVFANVTDLTTVDLIASLDVTTITVDIPPTPPFPLTTVPFDEADGGAVTNLVRIEEVAATGTVHGTTFNDRDGDKVRDDGEEGVEGAIIYVDANDNDSLDDGEITTVTDSDGRYAFSLELEDADVQDFIIRQAEDQRFVQTAPEDGFYLVTVRPGLDTDEVDFGNQLRPLVEIEASDPTAAEEGPQAGSFRIFISNADTAMIPDTLQVFYTVGGTAGESVDYVLNDNFVILGSSQTSATVDIVPIDDDDAEGAETVELTLTPVVNEYNVGANSSAIVTIIDTEASASLSGFVYLDVNANDTLDEGDMPIGGVTVRLDGPNGFSEVQVTAADGSYSFDALAAGDYMLTEDPDGELRQFLEDGADTVGSQGGTVDSDNDEISITDLPANAAGTGNNFGEGPRLGEFFSKRDFLSSTPEANVLAAIDTIGDETQWFSVDEAWQDFAEIEVLLSDDLYEVTLTVTDANNNTQSTTIYASDAQRVRFLGNMWDIFLVSIAGEPADYGFATPEPASAVVSQNIVSSRAALSIPATDQTANEIPLATEAGTGPLDPVTTDLVQDTATGGAATPIPADLLASAAVGHELLATAFSSLPLGSAYAAQASPPVQAPLASDTFFSVIYAGGPATDFVPLDVGRNVLPDEEEPVEDEEQPPKEEATKSDEDEAPLLGLTDEAAEDAHVDDAVEDIDRLATAVSYEAEVPDDSTVEAKSADGAPQASQS